MWSRSDDSILTVRRQVFVLATLVSIGFMFLVYALGNAASAQDGGGSGNLNIEANNCSQIQIIFINQYLNNGDHDGEGSREGHPLPRWHGDDHGRRVRSSDPPRPR